MTTAQVVETSVTVNNSSPIQDYVYDQTQPTLVLREITWFHMTYHCWPETTKNTRVKWTSQDWSCLVYVGSDVISFNYLWMARKDIDNTPMRLCLWSPDRLHCAVNFLYVFPFLHHRLPFRRMFCNSISLFWNIFLPWVSDGYGYLKSLSMIILTRPP